MQHAGDAAAAEAKAKGDKGDPEPRGAGVAVRNAALAGGDTLVAELAGRRCAATVVLGGQQGGAGAGSGELDLWLDGEHFHFTWVVDERRGGRGGGIGAAGLRIRPQTRGSLVCTGFHLPSTVYHVAVNIKGLLEAAGGGISLCTPTCTPTLPLCGNTLAHIHCRCRYAGGRSPYGAAWPARAAAQAPMAAWWRPCPAAWWRCWWRRGRASRQASCRGAARLARQGGA